MTDHSRERGTSLHHTFQGPVDKEWSDQKTPDNFPGAFGLFNQSSCFPVILVLLQTTSGSE